MTFFFRNGVKQYSAYKAPSQSLGTHLFGKKTIGYKVETGFLDPMTIFLISSLRRPATEHRGARVLPAVLVSTRASQASRRKRSDWESVPASLEGPVLVLLGLLPLTACTTDTRCFTLLGRIQTHNLQEYRRLLAQRNRGHFWDSDYYSNYYSTNQV